MGGTFIEERRCEAISIFYGCAFQPADATVSVIEFWVETNGFTSLYFNIGNTKGTLFYLSMAAEEINLEPPNRLTILALNFKKGYP